MTLLERLRNDFYKLSEPDKRAFLNEIAESSIVELSQIKKEVNETARKQCPHCREYNIVANGKYKGVQRYKCKPCGKNFSEYTGTCLAHIKKPYLWNRYLGYMIEGYSIAKSAKLTGISIQTAFDWRHKILSSLTELSPKQFEGISESDDIYFSYSEKGNKKLSREPRKRGKHKISAGISNDKVSVILTCDRKKNKDLQVIKRGRIRKEDIEKVLSGRLDKEAILCTDSHWSYTAFAKAKGIKHEKIIASKGQHVKNKIYHVQNANQIAKSLKHWMDRFNGVATKYLQNYLSWYLILEDIKSKTNKTHDFALAALFSINAWNNF